MREDGGAVKTVRFQMNCPLRSEENIDVLLDYPAGRLGPEKAAAFERHMQSCPDCAALGMDQAAVWKALDALVTPVSQDFNR